MSKLRAQLPPKTLRVVCEIQESQIAKLKAQLEERDAYIKVLQDRQSKMIDDAFKRALS